MKSLALVLCFSVAAILAAPQYEECQTRNKIIYVEEYEDECHNEYREECSYTTEYVEKCTTEKKKVCEESWKDDGYGGRVWTEDESKCRWLEADKCKDVPQLVKKCEPKPERLCTKVHKNKPYQHECQYCGGEYRDCKRLDTNDDCYTPSSGSVSSSSSSSDMPQPLAPQTTCNDKESEDLAIQLKEAVATAELLEGAIKSILSSFDLYTEKYDSNTGLPTENITLSDKPGIGKCFVEELSKRCFVESNEFKCDECGGVFGIPLTFCLNGGLSACYGGGNTVYGGNVHFRRFSRPAPQRPPWSFFPRP